MKPIFQNKIENERKKGKEELRINEIYTDTLKPREIEIYTYTEREDQDRSIYLSIYLSIQQEKIE